MYMYVSKYKDFSITTQHKATYIQDIIRLGTMQLY